jgi:hypothetical protein
MDQQDELERAIERVCAILPSVEFFSEKALYSLADLIEDQEAEIRGIVIRVLSEAAAGGSDPSARLFEAAGNMAAELLNHALHSIWQNENEPPNALDEPADELCQAALDFAVRRYASLTSEVLGVEAVVDQSALSKLRTRCILLRENFKEYFRANRLGRCSECLRHFSLGDHSECPYCSGEGKAPTKDERRTPPAAIASASPSTGDPADRRKRGSKATPRPDGESAPARQAFIAPHIAPTPKKLSLSPLAGKIGIAQSSLSRWYHGHQRLSAEKLGVLAEHLGVDPGQIPN